ncbi:MAG TPA: glycosyltransferase [Solirubrobacterales bacterium]|nr:glycosyltransferase [Solirubrobacterales bacterium]
MSAAAGMGRLPQRAPTPWINHALRLVCAIYLTLIVIAVIAYKSLFIEVVVADPFFGIYSVVVCVFILSRFLFSLFYRPAPDPEQPLEPTVAVVMPAFNEEEAVANSIRSLLAVDYPREKLEIVVVNDGSTDGTLREIYSVADRNRAVRVLAFPENRGKRAAMAAGIRATRAAVVAFVDSDSSLDPDALRRIVRGFADPRVGAIAGHAEVQNARDTLITRMQAVRYFVAFRVCKAAESIFGAVTCCSGCFSAYRREAITPVLERWEHQRFLGRPATYGDDRSLTNFVLRHWKVHYDELARSQTIVPAHFRLFLRQQLRWKRSWTRESLIIGRFIWRKSPLASLWAYLGIVLPLIAPVVAVRAVAWQPLVGGAGAPFIYLIGIYAMALVYGLYYGLKHGRYDTLWVFGVIFVFFYLTFLLWQTYWAILTSRNSSWGTRGAPAEATP